MKSLNNSTLIIVFVLSIVITTITTANKTVNTTQGQAYLQLDKEYYYYSEVSDNLEWTLMNITGGSSTVYAVGINSDPSINSTSYQFSVMGEDWAVPSQSKTCKLFRSGLDEFLLYKFNSNAGQFEELANLTQTFAAVNFSDIFPAKVLVSEDCERVVYDEGIWEWKSGSSSFEPVLVHNSSASPFRNWTSIDKNLEYFLENSNLYRFESSNSSYVLAGSTLTEKYSQEIFTFSNRILIKSNDANDLIRVQAFTYDSSNGLEAVFNYATNSTTYDSEKAEFDVSPELTKVLMGGRRKQGNSSVNFIEGYHIDYSTSANTTIAIGLSFPQTTQYSLFLTADENLFYIVTMTYEHFNGTFTKNSTQYFYTIDQNQIIQLQLERQYPFSKGYYFGKTNIMRRSDNNNLAVFNMVRGTQPDTQFFIDKVAELSNTTITVSNITIQDPLNITIIEPPIINTTNHTNTTNTTNSTAQLMIDNSKKIVYDISYYYSLDKEFYFVSKIPREFAWTFMNITGGSSSAQAISINPDPNVYSNSYQFSVMGEDWAVPSQSKTCKLFRSGLDEFLLYKFNSNAGQFEELANLTQTFAAVNFSDIFPAKVLVSEDCERVVYDEGIWEWKSGSSSFEPVLVHNSSASPFRNWTSIDKNLEYFLENSNLYRFESSNSSYVLAGSTLTEKYSQEIFTFSNRILIKSNDANDLIRVQAFTYDSSNGLEAVFNYATNSTTYDSEKAEFDVSPELTKVLMGGRRKQGNSSVNFIEGYHIDYSTSANTTIAIDLSFPQTTQYSLFLTADENLFYIVTMTYEHFNGTFTKVSKEYFFTIDNTITINFASSDQVPITRGYYFGQTKIMRQDNGTIVVYNIVRASKDIQFQVAKIAEFNTNLQKIESNSTEQSQYVKDPSLGIEEVDGKVKVCEAGCSQCKNGVCKVCFSGYSLDDSTKICYLCDPTCKQCDSTNSSLCTSCFKGYYLSTTTCTKCQAGCIGCTGPMECTVCPPGSYPTANGTTCTDCPKNCKNCSIDGTCQTCYRGFTLNSTSNECIGCFMTCSECSSSDITLCSNCSAGLYLNSNTCQQCPSKCLQCTNDSYCENCKEGYHPNKKGVCILDCEYPCMRCYQNRPSVCTGCYYGANLVNGKCRLNVSCNSNKSCDYCGVGYNYILSSGECIKCSSIQNCIQTNADNCFVCKKCKNGYYVSNQTCQACSQICSTCVSSDTCTSCVDGYYLPDEDVQGACLSCATPCKTCQNSANQCIQCSDGFNKRGWKCRKNRNVGFVIVFVNTQEELKPFLTYIVSLFLSQLSEDPTSFQLVLFFSISSGSTIIQGQVEPQVQTQEEASISIANAINSISDGANLTVSSSSVVINDVSTTDDQGSQKSIIPIVGGVVGTIFFILAVIIVIYCHKKRKLNKIVTKEVIDNKVQEMNETQNNSQLRAHKMKNSMINKQPSVESTNVKRTNDILKPEFFGIDVEIEEYD